MQSKFYHMGRLDLVIETEKICIYSPKYTGEDDTEFEKFLKAHKSLTNPQLKSFFDAIISAIHKMGECGARENLFRNEGGNVKALPLLIDYSRINKRVGKIRLYCIRISEKILIIGNGGISTENQYENDSCILATVNSLRDIDKTISRIAKQAGTNYEDFDSIRKIIEIITL